jgi:DNA-binding transcriptional MocR family regulator
MDRSFACAARFLASAALCRYLSARADFRSCRDAARALGLHKDTVARRYAENEHYGFLRKTSEGFLGSDGRGIAARYRFTDLAYGTHAPTRDFETWDGPIFTSREGRKKQKPVLPRRTPRPTA